MTNDANNGNALGDTFVFFPTFRQQLRAIKNKEAELRMRYAIEDYGIDGTLPDFSDIDPLGVMDGMFEQFKYAIDTAKANRMKQSQTNSENGKKGGRPRKEKPTESEKKREKPTESEKSLNVNVNVNDTHNLKNCVCDKGDEAHTHNYERLKSESDNKQYIAFLDYILKHAPTVAKSLTPMTEKQFQAIRKAYGSENMGKVLMDLENKPDYVKKYSNLHRTMLNWLKREVEYQEKHR